MPKQNKGSVASEAIVAALDLHESGEANTLTDRELMQAVALANARAFSLLMGRHVPKMVALARRITLNAHDADEVVQEAFLRVWIHAPRWDTNGPAQFRTWLQRIVTNLAIDFNRRPKQLPLEVAGDPPDPGKSAETGLQESDEARVVHQALEHLPPRQRAAVALYYFEELTAAEAADALGLTLGATEALLVRARKGLKHVLAVSNKAIKSGD